MYYYYYYYLLQKYPISYRKLFCRTFAVQYEFSSSIICYSSMNLGICCGIHFFTFDLKILEFELNLILEGNVFHTCEPRNTKLCTARDSLALHLIILLLLVSFVRYLAKYSGSPLFLMLKTIIRV